MCEFIKSIIRRYTRHADELSFKMKCGENRKDIEDGMGVVGFPPTLVRAPTLS